MPSIERTPNQRRMRTVATLALVLSIIMILAGIFAFYAILMALYVIDFSPEAAAANATKVITMAPLLLRL